MVQPRYKMIVDAMAQQIRCGELHPGSRLPTVRELMRQHHIASATALRVYSELEAVGLVSGEVGRGTFVRDASIPRGQGLQQRVLASGAVDLTFSYPALPDQGDMLREGLRALAASGDLDGLLHAAPHGGRTHERAIVARHLRNRGIRVGGDQILIVNGAQQGLAVTATALLAPGDVLVCDALTYPGMKLIAQAHRLDLVSVPSTLSGMDVKRLQALCEKRPVRAVYTMPTLHNPLGTVMRQSDRLTLAALAERYDFTIIEDGAYAFLAEPAPKPIFVHAPERTIYVSGFSKSIASGLRMGFIAAPLSKIAALEKAIALSCWSTPSLISALACGWIEDGTVDTMEERKREDARHRQQIAQKILKTSAGRAAGLSIMAHPSSYFLWIGLPDDLRAEQVAAALAAEGVVVATAEPFAAGPQVPHAFRLALGSIAYPALREALLKVKRAIGY